MQDKKAVLIPEATYHVYNRANGAEKLFLSTENYRFFLERYKQYVSPAADTFCYCLMPNHFHFLLRIKKEEDLIKTYPNPTGFENLSGLLSKEFSNLFNSYSKAFNKQENRKGSLFMRPFKRKKITDQNYLQNLVRYIHYNPVEARLTRNPEEWKYSSYNTFLNHEGFQNHKDLISKEEVIEWFGDKENFIHCHRLHPKETGITI